MGTAIRTYAATASIRSGAWRTDLEVDRDPLKYLNQMTNWTYNLIQNMMWVAALPEAFRLGEAYGRALEDHSRTVSEKDPDYEVYKSWTKEQRDAHYTAEQAGWEELNAQVWHSGCGRAPQLAHCVICGFGYNASWGGPKQGSGCCAWTFFQAGRWWLAGGYGSSVADMTMFEVVEPNCIKAKELFVKITQGRTDPICDCCLYYMINIGILVNPKGCNP